MSKHFKNQASKRRRDGYRRRSQQGVRRLVEQIFRQSEDIARLKSENKTLQFDNNELLGKVREGNRIIAEREIIHDSIVKELGKKLNSTTDSRNWYRFMFWTSVALQFVYGVLTMVLRFVKH